MKHAPAIVRETNPVEARPGAVPAARSRPGSAWRLCRRFPFGYPNHYVFFKLLLDAVYEATLAALRPPGVPVLPLLDVGCGPGLLALYLRAAGFEAPIHGIDYDPRKVETARRAAHGVDGCTFAADDARDGLPDHCGHVTILDILQFFSPSEASALLQSAASRVAPGGRLIIRTCLRDGSWRFRLTRAGDWLAKATFWMKDHAMSYPARSEIVGALESAGLRGTIHRLSGTLPFNNYLLVFERSKPS